MHDITIFQSNGVWLAKYSDPAIRGLFGVDTLPTAFLASAPAEIVADELARRNPDKSILIER